MQTLISLAPALELRKLSFAQEKLGESSFPDAYWSLSACVSYLRATKTCLGNFCVCVGNICVLVIPAGDFAVRFLCS